MAETGNGMPPLEVVFEVMKNGTSTIMPGEEGYTTFSETITNEAPSSVSLAVSVALGVVFLVTLVAIVTGVKAPDTKRAREMLTNVLGGNWSVVMKSMQFAMVSGGSNAAAAEGKRRKKIRIDKNQKDYGQKKRIKP
jgi:hypothetical protein